MRKIVACIAALLLASPVPVAAGTPFAVDTGAILRITCANGVGTAFHVGDGRYITAAHVVADCKADAPILVYDEEKDYAILLGPVIDSKIKYRCAPFKSGDEYLAVGYAHGWENQTSIPLIASKYSAGGFQAFIGEAIPGMSGGPVLDEDGYARGVVNMRWPGRSQELRDTLLCGEF